MLDPAARALAVLRTSPGASAVQALPEPPKFSPLQRSKAEVATWLAWQKRPGHGLDSAVREGLLDTGSHGYLQLVAWLNQIFRA